MTKIHPIAILQIIPNHHELLPARLIKALAMLDGINKPYSFYDIERATTRDFRTALLKLFASIKEDTVLVSMACHNNYPKIESLIFLYMYLPLLKDKKVVICSAYFSLYETALISRSNVEFSSLEIDEYINRNYGAPDLSDEAFFDQLENALERYGYQKHKFWSYLTFGCHAKCSFCYNRLPFAGSPDITRRSAEHVMRWMKFAKRSGKTYFEFSEPNFLSDRPFALEFVQRLKRENPGVTWRCKTRLDDIDQETYEEMRQAGCRTIFFGVEHVDLFLLQRVRKGEDSAKKLAEFMSYRNPETVIHLSFMTGIRGEKPDALKRNLDMVMRMGSVPDVDPNIGWQMIFNRKERAKTYTNFIVAFLFVMNFLPKGILISPELMRDILRMSIREPFFDFLYLTEAEEHLALMQQLVVYLKSRPNQKTIRDYDRVLAYEGGMITKLILQSRTEKALNIGILTLTGV